MRYFLAICSLFIVLSASDEKEQTKDNEKEIENKKVIEKENSKVEYIEVIDKSSVLEDILNQKQD